MPTACAAMPMRPLSSMDIASLNPTPKGPNKLALGILQSSKLTVAVDDARMPSLSSFFPVKWMRMRMRVRVRVRVSELES